MKSKVIAIRYARALVHLIGVQDSVFDSIKPVFDRINDLFDTTEAHKVLVSPVIPKALKRKLLEYAVGEEEQNTSIKTFFCGVVDAGRSEIIPDIIKHYGDIVDQENNRVNAQVIAAVKLGPSQLDLIAGQLQRIFHKEIILEEQVDESLLGGFVAKVENTVIDLSLRSKLEQLTTFHADL